MSPERLKFVSRHPARASTTRIRASLLSRPRAKSPAAMDVPTQELAVDPALDLAAKPLAPLTASPRTGLPSSPLTAPSPTTARAWAGLGSV